MSKYELGKDDGSCMRDPKLYELLTNIWIILFASGHDRIDQITAAFF